MSPNDPLPTFRPSLYLFPTRSSNPVLDALMMITPHAHARSSPRERVRTPLRSRAREKLNPPRSARLSRASDDSDASLSRRPSSRVARARETRAKIHATAMRAVRRPCDSCATTRGRRSSSDAVARSRGRVGHRCSRSIDRSNLARSISRSMEFRARSILGVDRMARASIDVLRWLRHRTSRRR